MQRNYDYILKVCFIGESSVGKTALLKRYADDVFEEEMLSTIGVDFKFKSINVMGSFVKLQLWDTAGQERFRSIIQSYYKDADALILVYDINSPQSFQVATEYWYDVAKKNAKSQNHIYFFANKCDMKPHISEQEKQWCQKEEISCYEVSAKTGSGVVQGVEEIVANLIEGRPKRQPEKLVMTLEEENPPQKKRCCK